MVAPQSTDNELPAAITLTDMLAAGAEGFLTAYDGAEVPCELPDCPYVASIVAGEFMALCLQAWRYLTNTIAVETTWLPLLMQ